MPTDDLDDLLRRAMKTLDDQVPSGYFEALPNQTLARLEASMQSTGTGTERDPSTGVPPIAKDEDSGLHDIRNLAQSTKQRLSSKRITTSPPADEDVLASSSAGWKAVALPEPAKMVSLPALDELPPAKEVRAKDRASRDAAAVDGTTLPTSRAQVPAVEAPARPAATRSKRTLAIVGVGLAAAAGAVIFVATRPSADKADKHTDIGAEKVADSRSRAPVAAPQGQPAFAVQIAAPSPETTATPPAAADVPPDDGTASNTQTKGAVEPAKAPKPAPPVSKTGHGAAKSIKAKPDGVPSETTKPETKSDAPTKKPRDKAEGGGEGSGEPSFDQLLKEAGVDQNKKVQKPKLEAKSLSESDFKHGIAGVAAKAQACYKGTQGTATVKLVVAPSGQVTKVSVGGQFAGKPEADCVVSAVKSASFPPWDGGPQSFSYAYLLSE